MNLSETARRRLLLAGLGALGSQLDLDAADAQDAVKVMPKSYRVVLENDKVRVLEFTGRPGMGICGEGVHSHPAHLTVVLNNWHLRATLADGTVRERERSFGEVFWSEAETHKVENTGKNITRALIIELKTPGAKCA